MQPTRINPIDSRPAPRPRRPAALPPDWVGEAVFYQIFPDRFARSRAAPPSPHLEAWDAPPTPHGFKGGDLGGIVEHLDYLVALGITGLYLTPIFQSAANHRYHTHDYHRVDPLLGGDEAFRALLDAAHARGMRVVLDGVFNHASRGFFPFHHLLENGPASPYRDWFTVSEFPLNAYHRARKPNYAAWANLPALPKLNTEHPDVREFIMQAAEHWLRAGIDGWRLDVPEQIRTAGFWEQFRRRAKAVNPEAYLVGEIWHDAAGWLEGDRFDAVMNYGLTRACLGFFGGERLDMSYKPGGIALRRLTGVAFLEELARLLAINHPAVGRAQLNLLGSHDTPRFLTMVGGETPRLMLAVLLQMTFPGAPCVYYGDEIGLTGGRDPDCRGGFPWEQAHWDRALHRWFTRCIRLRHAHAALRHGEFLPLDAGERHVVFARRAGDAIAIVALNAGESAVACAFPAAQLTADGAPLVNALTGKRHRAANGILTLDLAPLGGALIIPEAP